MSDKRYKMTVTALTPIHIGSGVFLQNNTDFCIFTDKDEYRMISVIDEKKILDLVGLEHLNDWVNSIETGENVCDFVKRYAPKATPESFSKRCFQTFYEKRMENGSTLKECMHDGMGRPYIPGSSIKGAIRTCVLASILNESKDIDNLDLFDRKNTIEKQVFGSEPNYDVFRFVQIGDAFFTKNCEIATMLINLNIKRTESDLKDKSKKQLVEAIGSEEEAISTIKIETERNRLCKLKDHKIKQIPSQMSSVESLFKTINQHTLKLLKEEVEIWEDVSQTKSGAETYIENIQSMIDEVKGCTSKECVLRLGHSSGWRFITGAWTERRSDFDRKIVPDARPHNKDYEEYMFPKSRRLDDEDYILGFIKLSLTDK